MQYSRLVIEEGTTTFSLSFHPRLTVVAGVDSGARKGLVAELIGGLGSTRTGVNLELADDRGRRLAVLRPASGGHRIIELNSGTDVSDEFRATDGRLDVLGRYGIDARTARDRLHLDRTMLERDARRDERVQRLSELDQTELWSTAARVRITEDEMQAISDEHRASAEDAELVARIERHHQGLEEAVEQHKALRRDASLVCGASLFAAVPVSVVRPELAVPILVIGMATILLAFMLRARVEAVQRMEQSALADAGVDSYLGYVVGRVDQMMDDTEARRRRLAVAEDHRAAALRWTNLVGDVNVEWALAHHEEIETAARLRRDLATLSQVSSTAPEIDDLTSSLAQALIAHLGRLRTLGSGGESLPLILDDPFTEVAPSTKLTLVELLARSAGSPQVILLTDQDEVATWARLEALTGEVALVEPAISTQATPRSTPASGSGNLAV
ncbi:MAG: hypothetical protein KDB04_18720 [Acidimicrobiales bacterium]|nr:hypothetical protein [Acidimicrobiales bacterium]HRW39357.1 hypothetical protein [Aquihabitans sp.]